MNKKDFSKFSFFVNPCFICSNMNWESEEGEYGTGGSYASCVAEHEIYEKWQDEKNNFPYCECPKRCIRRNVFEFNINFDTLHECDYYEILSKITNNFRLPENKKVSNIAYSVTSFNSRLRQYKTV